MKLTRFTQSCILFEKAGKRIVIDPGEPFMEAYGLKVLGRVSAVFFTHEHFDHFSQTAATGLHAKGAQIFGNKSIAEKLGGLCQEVKDGHKIEVAGFVIEPRDVDHSDMVDGSRGPKNTGYIIDQTVLHPGDGKALKHAEVPVLLMPLLGPDISPRDAFAFGRQVKAKQVIPIHYDLWGANPAFFARVAEMYKQPFSFTILAVKESTDI